MSNHYKNYNKKIGFSYLLLLFFKASKPSEDSLILTTLTLEYLKPLKRSKTPPLISAILDLYIFCFEFFNYLINLHKHSEHDSLSKNTKGF